MKKWLAFLLVVLLVTGTMGSMAFAEGHKTYGEMLKDLGVINGDANGNLNGDKELTRGELIAIISTLTTPKVDSFTSPVKASFADVPSSHWAFKHVERAKTNGISNGLGNGKFGVNDKVTYKQAKAFMLNVLGYKTVAWDNIDVVAADVGLYSEYAVNATKFTRDMMFDLILSTLTSYTYDGEIFFDTARKNTNLGWQPEDLDNIWMTYEIKDQADSDIVQNDEAIVDMTKYKFFAPLTALSDAQQKIFGSDMSKTYAEQFDGKEFKFSIYSNLMHELSVSISETEYVNFNYDLFNEETKLNDQYTLELIISDAAQSFLSLKDGSDKNYASYTALDVVETKTDIIDNDGNPLKGYVVNFVNDDTNETVLLVLTLHKSGAMSAGFLLGDGMDALLY